MALLCHAKMLSLESQVAQLLWVLLCIYNLCLHCFHTRLEAACHKDISVNVVVETDRGVDINADINIPTGKLKWKRGEEETLWRKEMLAVLGTNLKFIQDPPAAKTKKGKRIDSIVTSSLKLIP